ncbi:hypothetical protein [Entomobacter blattae]|uniref:hypothetical protein n=1 Tax=Entomobacter blattae TaxID=2762277 RepID=UPI00193BF770|nr:hypothetical protein [Entomobacter blattae]
MSRNCESLLKDEQGTACALLCSLWGGLLVEDGALVSDGAKNAIRKWQSGALNTLIEPISSCRPS